MEIDLATTLGITAGILSTIAYLPQVIKTWKSKSAKDISWNMLIILCTGVILWLIYSVSIRDVPMTAANAVTLLLTSVILTMKIKYSSSEDNT
ncbi:MAG: SemiSWEET transporter [Chroococcidiopsidaceae cyanobacterium CP_BM_ER_R8_30]|nr:SemiSWEET transporter [Chroococcidiopsidaceae cyanobacterium CP_BM_ER_R8_30]